MSQAKYLVIDTETTGFYPQKNGLIQLSCLVTNSKLEIIDTFDYIVNPPKEVEITKESLEITNFTIEKIKTGVSYQEVSQLFLEFLNKYFSKDYKPIIIAQFFPFDWAFLQQVFVSTGFEQKICQDLLQNDFIDTKVLANFANLKAKFNNKELPFLSTSLSKKGGLKDKLNLTDKNMIAHNALGDCLATLEVLKKILVIKNLF